MTLLASPSRPARDELHRDRRVRHLRPVPPYAFQGQRVLRMCPEPYRQPDMNRMSGLKPSFHVVSIVHAHILPDTLSTPFGRPSVFTLPPSRCDKNECCLRRINILRVLRSLLVIILGLCPRVLICPHFPHRRTLGHKGVSGFRYHDAVPAGELDSFTATDTNTTDLRGCRQDKPTNKRRQQRLCIPPVGPRDKVSGVHKGRDGFRSLPWSCWLSKPLPNFFKSSGHQSVTSPLPLNANMYEVCFFEHFEVLGHC